MNLGIYPNLTPRLQAKNNQQNYMAKTNCKAASDTIAFSAKKLPTEKLELATRNLISDLDTNVGYKKAAIVTSIYDNFEAIKKTYGQNFQMQLTPTVKVDLSNLEAHKKDPINVPLQSFTIQSGYLPGDCQISEGENVFDIFMNNDKGNTCTTIIDTIDNLVHPNTSYKPDSIRLSKGSLKDGETLNSAVQRIVKSLAQLL